MINSGSIKKERKNPNDPARFIGKMAVTGEDEAARIHHYLDTDKISEETLHDGLYACCWFFFGFGFNRLHQFPFVLQNVQTLPVKE